MTQETCRLFPRLCKSPKLRYSDDWLRFLPTPAPESSEPSQAWLPSLGDDLSELLIPLVAFIEFSGQRETADPLENHIKQMCDGIGSVLNSATKNAYYREGRRACFGLRPILNGKAFITRILFISELRFLFACLCPMFRLLTFQQCTP